MQCKKCKLEDVPLNGVICRKCGYHLGLEQLVAKPEPPPEKKS